MEREVLTLSSQDKCVPVPAILLGSSGCGISPETKVLCLFTISKIYGMLSDNILKTTTITDKQPFNKTTLSESPNCKNVVAPVAIRFILPNISNNVIVNQTVTLVMSMTLFGLRYEPIN